MSQSEHSVNVRLRWANKKLEEIERTRNELLKHIGELYRELETLRRTEGILSFTEVTRIARESGITIKSIKTVGNGVTFVYETGGVENFVSYDDADEGVKQEIERLKEIKVV